jgi:putative oxidoreductase
MTVLRRLARPMLASVFVVDGLDSVRHPDAHTAELERVRPQVRKLTEAVGLPDDPRLLVRIGGAIKLVAGFSLATSRMPRIAALVLAVLTVKDTVLRYPVWQAQGPVERQQLLDGALRSASLVGGLLIAGADTAGKPSLAWRARAVKDRAAAKLDR